MDSEDDEEEHDNDKGNDEQELFWLKPREALTMLDRLVHMSGIIKEERKTLVYIRKFKKEVFKEVFKIT